MKRCAVVFASAIVAACGGKGPKLAEPIVTTLPNGAVEVQNSGPSAWVDTLGWKLVEVYRVGGSTTTGPEELVHPLSVAVDQAGGIYVGDMGPAVVKQFGPTGVYIRSIGREGGGPGEFKASLVATAPGLLVVHDPGTARTSVFDSAGGFLRSWNSSCCNYTSIVVSSDSVIYVPTSGQPSGVRRPSDKFYLRTRLDGTLVDTMHIAGPEGVGQPLRWSFESANGNQYFVPVPLTPAVWVTISPAGGAVLGWSGTYRFVATRTGLDTTQIVTLEANPVTVTDAQRIHLRDSLVKLYGDGEADRQTTDEAFKLADIPFTAPYFESIAVDGSGNRWVRRIGGATQDAARFDVFDSTGAYLGAVPVPAEFGNGWKTVWGTDRVATMLEDKEGFPVVVVYGVEKP